MRLLNVTNISCLLRQLIETFGVLNSPFKPFKLRFYLGELNYGTPYFLPRRLIKDKNKPGYLTTVPKKIGFDFVFLGWKTKWSEKDIRFEWSPLISFVFFKYQFCIFFEVPETHNYWEAWLYYLYYTNKSKNKKERLKQCMEEFKLNYTVYSKDKTYEVNYYNNILRKKYLKLI